METLPFPDRSVTGGVAQPLSGASALFLRMQASQTALTHEYFPSLPCG